MPLYKDYPRDELVKGAEGALRRYAAAGYEAQVHFKATCPKCGARPMFREPNLMFDSMECDDCGTTFPFTVGNYAIQIKNDLAGGVDPEEAIAIMHAANKAAREAKR